MSQPARADSYASPSPMPGMAEAALLVARFGALPQDPERVIVFPRGRLGFAHHHRHLLAEIPGADAAFKLLQSIDDPELSFVVLPLGSSDGPIAGPDLVAARTTLAIDDAALAVLVIVTVRTAAERVDFTVNQGAALGRHREASRLSARPGRRQLSAAPSHGPRRLRSCRLSGASCTLAAPVRAAPI